VIVLEFEYSSTTKYEYTSYEYENSSTTKYEFTSYKYIHIPTRNMNILVSFSPRVEPAAGSVGWMCCSAGVCFFLW